MGVFNSSMFAEPNSEVFYRPPDNCFYCGNKLTGDRWIFWNGNNSQIWMHPECANRLSYHLLSDFIKLSGQKENERK